MAISSLNKLSVPLSGNQSANNQGLLMPKLGYRFRVLFQNFGVSKPTTELTKQVISAARPSPEFDSIVLDVYNSRIKLAGKPKWGSVEVVIRDDALGAVSKLVGEQLQKQFDFFEQASASSGIDYKFTTRIELLDGGNGAYEPVILETFELYGCYLGKATYKGVDYSKGTEALDISLSLEYDNALQINTAGVPVAIGTNVGRTTRTFATG
jgi:hypothetical protein